MSKDLMDQIDAYRFNPTAIQSVIIDKVEAIYNGEVALVDPSNPFIHLLEAAAATASASMSFTEAATRKLYPVLSTQQEDLYRHMSDADYLGRFAYPSMAPFELVFSVDELKARAVLDSRTGLKKIVIPRDTRFTIAGYFFGIHYPIEIRVMSHGGIQAVYNGNDSSPLETLEANTIETETFVYENNEYIRLFINVHQFFLTPYYFPVSTSSGLIEEFVFDDLFFYCRVYTGNNTDGWREMYVTHSDQVYDPKNPTALAKVLEGKLRIEIPQIYKTSNQLGSQIRVDIYTTRGELDLILNNYPAEQFGAEWIDLANSSDAPYIAPLSSLSSIGIYSPGVTAGGRNMLSVDELRHRVVYGANNKPVPVTDEDLRVTLEDDGYSIMKRLDNITDRAYQVTRELPAPDSEDISASIGTLTEFIQVAMDKVVLLDTVRDNGNRITIEPETLYRYDRGLLSIVDNDERAELNSLSQDRLINELNDNTFLYTPFHYVLDFNEDTLEVRPYWLTSPEVISKRHVEENVFIPIQTTSSSLHIEQNEQGYRLLILVPKANIEDNVSIEQLQVQLGGRPGNESREAYCNGTLIGTQDDNFVYEFILATNFDMDEEGRIGLTSFQYFSDDRQTYFFDLESEFSIYFAFSSYPIIQSKRSEIDQRMGITLLPRGSVGNLEESCTIRFGKALTGLRNDSRSVVSSLEYETYESNVPLLYELDVYERDDDGLIKITQDDQGNPVYNLLHSAGDPVLDDLGQPRYKHVVGETKLDANKNPIIKETRKMNRQFIISLFDARYLFTANETAVAYRDSIPQIISEYLETDVASAASTLLERTELKFAPRRTLGNIEVTVRNGGVISIPSAHSFKVKYYMTEQGYRDLALRQSISTSTNETISGVLRNTTVTVNDIELALKDSAGDEVTTVEVSGLGEDGSLVIYTVVDPTAVSSLATRLELSNDGTIQLLDDVTIEYVKHST